MMMHFIPSQSNTHTPTGPTVATDEIRGRYVTKRDSFSNGLFSPISASAHCPDKEIKKNENVWIYANDLQKYKRKTGRNGITFKRQRIRPVRICRRLVL